MASSVLLLHEIWEDSENEPARSFHLFSLAHDELQRKIAPTARVVHAFYASDPMDAFNQYYALNDWGVCRPFECEPYTELQLQQQMAELALRKATPT